MKMIYEKPEVKVVSISANDIIMESNEGEWDIHSENQSGKEIEWRF